MPTIRSRFRRDESLAQGEDTLGDSLSHPEYRALVVKEALKSGKKPGSRTFFEAQKKVDAALGRLGASIEIPGALPRRRTV